jgi:hypothetical protein
MNQGGSLLLELILIKINRHTSSSTRQFDTSWSAPKTKAIWTRSLGWKSSSWDNRGGSQGPLLAGGDQRHRKPFPNLKEQLCLCKLSVGSVLHSCHAPFPRLALQWRSPCLPPTSKLCTSFRSTYRAFSDGRQPTGSCVSTENSETRW